MNNEMKISFIGDIMCEKPLLKASKKNEDFQFDQVFKNVTEKFHESDVVIGNCETIFAGADVKYTNDLYSFNTPDSFAKEMANSGISYITLANNHCLDRGIEGLNRTINILENVGIKTFGAYKNSEKRNEPMIIKCGKMKICLIGYTYCTNVAENQIVFAEGDTYHVNLLKSQKKELEKYKNSLKSNTFRGRLSKIIRRFINLEQRMKIKKIFGKLSNTPQIDNIQEGDIYAPYIEQLLNDVEIAKKEADFVIVCLHCGGLFNTKIGSFTEYIVDKLKKTRVDAIVGHHPHIVQKSTKGEECKIVAYSLGNFSISPSSVYLIRDDLPEYSIMLNMYFDCINNCMKNMSFSILKIVEDKNHSLTVYPIEKLKEKLSGKDLQNFEEDIRFIYNRFLNKNEIKVPIKSEYFI